MGVNGKGGFTAFSKSLEGLSQSQQLLIANSVAMSPKQKQYIADTIGATVATNGQIVATKELAGAQAGATATTSGFSAAMTGLGATLKATFISLATNPFTYLFAGLAVGAVALHNYITAFDKASEKAQESQSAYSSTTQELNSLKSEAESYKDTLESLADTYEIKITGNEDVSELIQKLESSDLSLEDRAQVEQIKAQNSELERQITLKQQLAEQQAKQTEQDAIDALKIEHTQDMTQQYTTYDKTGMVEHTQNRQTDIITASQNELEKLKQLKKDRQALFEDDVIDSKQTDDFETLDADIEKYTDSISSNIEQLNSLKLSFEDENGLMRSGLSEDAQKYYKQIVEIIDTFNNIDLTPAEQQLKAIESFFDDTSGTNFLKDELIEVAKSGEITTDTLADMGLTLGDLGLSGKDGLSALNKYFKDLASSADEANSSVKEFDGSLQSITDASESENQDKNWNTVSDLFDKAKELDKNKKWGTDDFQSMAQFIAPESAQVKTNNVNLKAADYKNLWDQYRGNFEKYFDTDNPLQSAINAQDKLLKSGLGSMDSSGIIKWSDSFKSSADAAKAWGISVEAAEVAMHNLESYGAEFDGITFNSEELKNYKSSLDGIRDIYDQMDEGSDRDRLGKLLQGWDEEYEKYEQDISTLNKDQVVKIKFEYDLASIQSQIDEIQELINSGDNTVKNNAKLIAGNQKYITTAEQGLGFDVEGVKVPVEYEANENTIEALKSQLKHATTEDDKLKIQAEIQNLQELQKDLLNAFSDVHPEINADSSMDEINAAWDDFVKSTEGQELIANITANDEDAKETIAKLLGIDVDDITVDVKTNINKDDIEKQLKEYSEGGNVDLTLRPVIDSSELINAGWDVPAGEAATVFSSTFSNELGNIAMNFTPIMTDENGNYMGVMSPEELQKYAEEVIAGVRDDDLNLKIGATYEGDDAIEQAVTAAEKIHELQEDYYINIEANDNASDVINKVSQEEIEDKIVTLTGVDDATPYINLWNIMSADPKFAELSADDQATLVLETYNSLSIDDKNSLISQTGGEATKGVADAVSASINAIPKNKTSTITITTIKKTITQGGTVKNSNGGVIAGGAAQVSGTMLSPAHASGTAYNVLNTKPISSAYAGGRVSLDRNERALVNEEYINGHSESIIRDGVWRLIPGGMHLENLKKGDIVLNAKQTDDLLRSGKTNGHARAYASGSLLSPAYASGMLSLGGSYGKSYGSTTTKASTSTTKATQANTDATKENTEAQKDTIDWIETLVDTQKSENERLSNAIENFEMHFNQNSAIDAYIKDSQAYMKTLRNAQNAYMSKANALGLDGAYVHKIWSGELSIEDITDEDLADKIKKYQDWYNQAKDLGDQLTEINTKIREAKINKLDNIKDDYDNLVDYAKSIADYNEAINDLLNKPRTPVTLVMG